MVWSLIGQIVPCVAAAIISPVIGLYAWRRRYVPGSVWFAFMSWGEALWVFGHLFESISPSLEWKILWDRWQAIPTHILPLLFLFFAVDYTGVKIARRRPAALALAVVPLIYSLLTIFGPIEWLMPNAHLVPGEPFALLVYDFSTLLLVETVFSYTLVLMGLLILVNRAARFPLYRAQTLTVILGTLIPTIGSLLTLVGLTPDYYRDLSPFASTLGGLIVMVGMFRYHLLEVVPASRRRIFEHIQDAVLVLDDRYIIDFNRAAQELFGGPDGLKIEQPVTEALRDWPTLLEHNRAAAEAQVELTHKIAGAQRYFELNVIPLSGLGGRVRIIVVRDVTARTQAELSLKKSEEHYRRLVEENPAAIAVLHDGKAVFVNRACANLLTDGDESALLNRPALDFVHPDEREATMKRLLEAQAGRPVALSRKKLLRLDDGVVYVDIVGIPTEYDDRPAVQLVFWDVTAQVRAEEELRCYRDNLEKMVTRRTGELGRLNAQLRAAEARMWALINASPDIICFKDGKGRLIEANRACLQLFGLEETVDYRGKKPTELFPDDDRRCGLAVACERKDEIAWALGTTYRDDEEITLPDGSKRVYDVVRVPLLRPDGGRQGIAILGRDITERAQMERALREAEARYRTVADFTYDWEYWVGPDGSMIYTSPSCERITGYPGEKFIEHPDFIKTLVVPEDRPLLASHIHTRDTRRGVSEIRFRIRRKDDQIVWIEHVCRPVIDENGEFLGHRGSNRDVTVYVQAEERLRLHRDRLEELVAERTRALQESEERFRSIVEQSHDGIVLMDDHGTIIEWAGGCEKIFGLSAEEAVGQPLWDVRFRFTPEKVKTAATYDYIRARIQRACAAREAPWFGKVEENEIRRPNGEYRFVQTTIFPIETGDKFMLGAIIRDVTAQKRTEMELRRLNQAVEQSANSVVITDTEGNIEYVNLKFVETTGYTAEEARGQNPRILKSGEHSEEFYKELWDTITSGETWKGEFHNKRKDGSLYWERAAISPVYDLDGHIVNFIAVKEDITERKWMEEAIQQRNIELTKLGEVIGVITSTLDLDEVLKRIIESTIQMFPDIYNATIQLLNEDGNLEMRAASSDTPVTERRMVLPQGHGIAGIAMQERRPVNVPDVTDDPRFVVGETPPAYRSLMSVPLTAHDQCLGTLTITSLAVDAFGADDARLLQTLAGYAALAVRNAHLYEQTQRDAETKAMLLKEVNHRVKNNLATIIGLLYAEKRHAARLDERSQQDILGELINRIQGLATVHSMLSASSWRPLPLSDLATQVIQFPLMALPANKNVRVEVSPSPVLVDSKQAGSLALVFNELAVNVVKYGLGERDTGRITVTIVREKDGFVRCEVRDDGPGYPEDVLRLERHNVGLYLVQTIVTRDLGGELTLENDNGAVTIIRFRNTL